MGGGKGREKGVGREGGGEGRVTWIARRARPKRMDIGFENVDIAIPLTRPGYFVSAMNVLFFCFISLRLFFFFALARSSSFFFFSSPFSFYSSPSFPPPSFSWGPHNPTKKKKEKEREARNQSSQTNQEYCRNLFLSILLRFLFFPAAAIAEIVAAVIEVSIPWRRRRRRRMIRCKGLVGGGGGRWWW